MKPFILFIYLSGLFINASACDVCGCAPASGGLGILPGFQKHFIGLRYQYQSFHSRPHESGEKYQKSREQFHMLNLSGRLVLNPRLQLLALLPYKILFRSSGQQQISNYGIGDMTCMLQGVIVNTASQERKFRHLLQAGLGVKMPTGRFNQMENGLILNPNMQCGTGSWDFPLHLNHTLRLKLWGLYSELNYSINQLNKFQNRAGNRTQISTRAFYWKEHAGKSWMPQAGWQYEHASNDLLSGKTEAFTGGESIQLLLGVDYYTRHLAWGLHLKQPVYQNLAQGYSNASAQIALQCIYLFNKNPLIP